MRCSVARGPRFFKWKMLRESGPHDLLLLQLLIALVIWLLVNDSGFSRDIRFTILRHLTSPPRVLAQLISGELTVETVGYHLG